MKPIGTQREERHGNGSLPAQSCGGTTETDPKGRVFRGKAIALALILLAHLVVSVAAVVPGYISIDEAIYHWMAKGFSDSGTLSVWNGYEEFPSPELHHPFLKVNGDKLFPQYPSLFAVLAWPFYRLAGLVGLFLLNSVAFVGVVVLCFFTAARLFQDKNMALNACFILVFATFAWDYSQAAWPHTLAVFFVMAAFYLSVLAYCSETRHSALMFAAGAGLVAGFAPGVRLDALLVFPALVLPFLFARPWRPWEAVMLVVALVPGVLALSTMNLVKFGVFSPVSYGGETVRQAVPVEGLVLVPAGLVVAAWVASRSRLVPVLKRHRLAFSLSAAALVVIGVLVFPDALLMLEHMLRYAYISLVDMRSLDPGIVLGAMTRSAGGGVVYIGAHKKALLQSLPFLVLLLVPLARIVRWDEDAPRLAILFLVPLTVVGYYCYSFIELEGGGLCLSNRYFLVCLPFFAILTGYAIKDLMVRWGVEPSVRTGAFVALGTAGVYLLLTRITTPTIDELEFPLLTLPLVIAAALLVLLIVNEFGAFKALTTTRIIFWNLLIAAMVWSGLVAFVYDYPHHRHARAMNEQVAERILPMVPDDSIFFVHMAFTPCVNLIEKNRVRLALPARDRFADFPRLLEFHLGAGRRALALFPDELWAQITPRLLSGYKTVSKPMFGGFHLAEISRPSTANGKGEGALSHANR